VMLSPSLENLVYGRTPVLPRMFSACHFSTSPPAHAQADVRSREAGVFSIFESLVRIVHSNERLFKDLETLSVKIRRARAYLAEPGCNRILGNANLGRLRAKRSGTLAQLRTNRIEAWEILSRLGPDGAVEIERLKALDPQGVIGTVFPVPDPL